MIEKELIYSIDNQNFHGFLAHPKALHAKSPAVLLFHDWTGRNPYIVDRAKYFAHQGYIALAADLFGEGRMGANNQEKQALIQPLLADRTFLLSRVQGAFEVLAALPLVQADKIMALGFCFGGLSALDLARSERKLAAAVSVHGILHPPQGHQNSKISAKILALHGYDDPMVPPDELRKFSEELTEAQADWQVHVFGLTQHAFTNPLASDPELGTVYHPLAALRTHRIIDDFFSELCSGV